MKRIFISHSSKDSLLVKAFVDRILILGLNIDKNEVFCTSVEEMGIKSGDDFKKEIENQLKQAKYVIQIITSNYKSSEVCLNEMGAAWMLAEKVIPFILSPVKYDNVGFIHSTTQLLKLNTKKDLLKFKDDNKDLFVTNTFGSENYDRQMEDFLKIFVPGTDIIKASQAPDELTFDSINSYFQRYLENDVDRAGLILKAQPTLSDCREIFTLSYFKEVHDFYNLLYRSILEDGDEFRRNIVNRNDVAVELVTYDDIYEKSKDLVVGASFPFSLNRGIKFYHVKFKEYNQDLGYTLNYWCYLNNRWVFFPKPYRIISAIDDLRTDKSLKWLVKFFKFFGMHKDLKKFKGRPEMVVGHVVAELMKKE